MTSQLGHALGRLHRLRVPAETAPAARDGGCASFGRWRELAAELDRQGGDDDDVAMAAFLREVGQGNPIGNLRAVWPPAA